MQPTQFQLLEIIGVKGGTTPLHSTLIQIQQMQATSSLVPAHLLPSQLLFSALTTLLRSTVVILTASITIGSKSSLIKSSSCFETNPLTPTYVPLLNFTSTHPLSDQPCLRLIDGALIARVVFSDTFKKPGMMHFSGFSLILLQLGISSKQVKLLKPMTTTS